MSAERGRKEDQIVGLLTRLHSIDDPTRFAALDDLIGLKRGGLTKAAGAQLLHGAASEFPPHRFAYTDIPSQILDVLMSQQPSPAAEWAEPAARLYGTFTDGARRNTLFMLAAIGTREAMAGYMRLLKEFGPPLGAPRLASGWVSRQPRHGDVVFPDLITIAAAHDVVTEALRIILAFVAAGEYPTTAAAALSTFLDSQWTRIIKQLQGISERAADHWRESYQEVRSDAALIIDVAGRISHPGVQRIIADALVLRDPRLVMFAILGRVRRGLAVPASAIAFAARYAEARFWLYVELRSLGQLPLFPRDLLNQRALAEAEMAHWLAYPTELGREPDDIETMGTVELHAGDGEPADLYVLRFRTSGDHWAADSGWMAGVAGPYPRSEQPVAPGLGATFSKLERWELRDLSGHAEANVGTLEEWATALGGSPFE